MDRRRHLKGLTVLPAGLLVPLMPLLLAGCGSAPVQGFATVPQARLAIWRLSPATRFSGVWTVPQVLNHLAQSIEYSVQGFPQPRSALFQQTAGRVAFAFFDARGAMSHSLHEPIPGAPVLGAALTARPGAAPDDSADGARGHALGAATARLLSALSTFEAHTGPLAPHFGYGALNKNEYTRAHLMHMANHWTELVPS